MHVGDPIPPDAIIGEPIPLPPGAKLVPTRVVTVPESVKKWTRPEQKTDAYAVVDLSLAKSEAEVMRGFTTSFLLPRPTFHLGSSARAHAWPMLGGLALFACGL